MYEYCTLLSIFHKARALERCLGPWQPTGGQFWTMQILASEMSVFVKVARRRKDILLQRCFRKQIRAWFRKHVLIVQEDN